MSYVICLKLTSFTHFPIRYVVIAGECTMGLSMDISEYCGQIQDKERKEILTDCIDDYFV